TPYVSTLCFRVCSQRAACTLRTLSLPDALPISPCWGRHEVWIHALIGNRLHPTICNCGFGNFRSPMFDALALFVAIVEAGSLTRSEEHTSELQSRENLVCRLLLDKKKALYESAS